MFALQDQAWSSFSKKKLIIGLALLVATVGTTLASTLTINTNNRVTFGQGLFQVKACDTWIEIIFQSTGTNSGVFVGPDEVQAVGGVQINGFDADRCLNRNFKIKAFKTGVTDALDLYEQDDFTPLVSSDNLPPSKQVWLSVDGSGVVSLLDTTGRKLDPARADPAVDIGFDSDTKQYLVYFFRPLQPAENVNSQTVESGPNA